MRRRREGEEGMRGGRSPEELVRLYLRGQNLEQMRAVDEAIVLYEQAVAGGFDSAGPYDRLLYIYREREANRDIIRVAEAALEQVRTFEQKRGWYTEMARNAAERLKDQPDARGSEF